MRSVLMIFLVLVVVMLGCSSDNGGEPKEMIGRPQAEGVAFNDSKIIDKRLIVLLDNSGSITDQSGKKAAKELLKIIKNLGEECHLLVYTTENNPVNPALVDEMKSVPLKPSERARYNSEWNEKIKKIVLTLVEASKEKRNETCILSGIKSIYNGLVGQVHARENYLVILSDMLECCNGLCPEKTNTFETAEAKINSLQLEDFPLSQFVPLENISVYFLTPSLKNRQVMGSSQLKQFWTHVFHGLGYDDLPTMSTSLDAFRNNNF